MPKDPIDLLEDFVGNLNLRWKLHKDLFQDQDHYDVFNKAGSNVWIVLRESLLDAIFMDIGRLMDPKVSSGRPNLSFEHVIHSIQRVGHAAMLDSIVADARQQYDALIKPWRNRRLGHNDLETATGSQQLPDVPFSEIDVLVSTINEIARRISLAERDIDRDFVPSDRDWTLKLFSVLRAGIKTG